MKFNLLRNTSLALALIASLALPACNDDEKSVEINNQEQWIGAACTCVGTQETPCEVMKVPMPSGSPISGCDNMPEVAGGQRVCLRTIPENYKAFAPPTYFPKGYCTISALGCTNSNLCEMAAYGDADNFTSCPPGSALLTSEFDYTLAASDEAHIVSKTCAKLCETDADCNTDGEMSCIEREGVKFCYNEQNFKYIAEPSVKVF